MAGPGGAVADANIVAHQRDPGAHPKVTQRIAAATGTVALDMGAADVFDLTLTGNVTLTVTNPPALLDNSEKVIILRQDGTGSRLLTAPAGWLFSGGSKTLTTAASSIDKITLRKDPLTAGQFLAELTKAYA